MHIKPSTSPWIVLLGPNPSPATAEAGRYTPKMYHTKDYPKIQILTIEGLLNGTERLDAPPQANLFAQAEREAKGEKQGEML